MLEPKIIIKRLGNANLELVRNVSEEIARELELATPTTEVVWINAVARLTDESNGAYIPPRQRELQLKAVMFLSDWQVIRGAEAQAGAKKIKITLNQEIFSLFYNELSNITPANEKITYVHGTLRQGELEYRPRIKANSALLKELWSRRDRQPIPAMALTAITGLSVDQLPRVIYSMNQSLKRSGISAHLNGGSHYSLEILAN